MTNKSDENKIRVYPLLEPSHYLNNKELLANLLFPDINVNREQKSFSVSPSGFISYSDYTELWKENAGERKLPKDAREAAEISVNFIQQVYTRFKDENKPEIKKKIVALPFPLFQPDPEAVSVLHPAEPIIDHWLRSEERRVGKESRCGCRTVH